MLPTSQTTNNQHFLPTIQLNNKTCAQQAEQKDQKTNIETKSSLNTTRNSKTIKKGKPEATEIEH